MFAAFELLAFRRNQFGYTGEVAEIVGLLDAIASQGVSLEGWLLAWARVLPTVLLVPAFGARFLPPAGRAVLGLSLGFVLAPSLSVPHAQSALGLALVGELLAGLPVAVGASALMWAAMMAGGLTDELRGFAQPSTGPFSEVGTPTGTLMGLFSAVAFFKVGGASRLALALSESMAGDAQLSVLALVRQLLQSIEIALALAAPVLVAVIVWEVAGALVARSASPAHIQALLAPLRALVVLSTLAISAGALFQLLSRLMAQQL